MMDSMQYFGQIAICLQQSHTLPICWASVHVRLLRHPVEDVGPSSTPVHSQPGIPSDANTTWGRCLEHTSNELPLAHWTVPLKAL